MKFACERCGKRFASVDEPAPGRVYRIRCRCGNVIHISAPHADPDGPRRGGGLPPLDRPRITGATAAGANVTPGPAIPPIPPGPRSAIQAGDATSRVRIASPTPARVADPAVARRTAAAAPPPTGSHPLATPVSELDPSRAEPQRSPFDLPPDLFAIPPADGEAAAAAPVGEGTGADPGTGGAASWTTPIAERPERTPPAAEPRRTPRRVEAAPPEFDPFAAAAAQARAPELDVPAVAPGGAAERPSPPAPPAQDGEDSVDLSVSEQYPLPPRKRRGLPRLALAAAVVAVVAAGAVGAFVWWENQGGDAVVEAPPVLAPAPVEAAAAAPPPVPAPATAAEPAPPTASAPRPAPMPDPAAAAPAVAAPVTSPAPPPARRLREREAEERRTRERLAREEREREAREAREARAREAREAKEREERARAEREAGERERLARERLAREEREAREREAKERQRREAAPSARPPAPVAAAAAPVVAAAPAAAPAPAPVPAPAAAPAPTPKKETDGLDPAVMQSVISRNRPALDACVAAALQDPATASYAGQKAALLLLVAPNGKAEAALEDGDLDASPFGACLRRAAGKMSFPPFKGEEVGARIVLQLGR